MMPRRTKTSTTHEERSITWVRLQDFVLGLPTSEILSIRAGRGQGATRPSIDLGSLLELDAPYDEESRVLEISAGQSIDLIARDEVSVEVVSTDDLDEVPAYVAGVCAGLAIRSIVRRAGGYGFLLDVAKLVSTFGPAEVHT